jgi:SNF2 family DNA or RNA helicase
MSLSKYLSNNNITNGIIVGKTSRKKRGEMINDFADGKLKTFLLTTRTASVGINLQKGSTIIFLEPVLSLSDNIQSIGRLYRIGQTQDINLLQLSTDKTYEFDMINTLKEFKEEEKQINRLYHGREKNRKQSIVKHKLYRHIVVEAV